MTYHLLGWLFAVAVTAHNLEEALLLPKWSQRAGRWHAPVGAFEFRFAVAVLTGLAYAVVALSSTGSVAAVLLSGYALAMLLNVFVPHVLASLVMRQYAPGTATAVALNLPICAALLFVGVRDGHVQLATLVWVGPVTVAAILGVIPLLFFLGRRLNPARS